MADASKSHLEQRVERLKALYHIYGAQGLRELDPADLWLLRSAKELTLQDVTKLEERDETLRTAKMRLELEIKDLSVELKIRHMERGIER